MGFSLSGLWDNIKSGASKVGEFVNERVRPVIGSIANGTKKISHFVNNDSGFNSFLDTVGSFHPGIGKAIDIGRKISQGVEKGADLVNSSLGFADRVGSAISNRDFGAAKGLVSEGKDLYGQGRNLYQSAVMRPNPGYV